MSRSQPSQPDRRAAGETPAGRLVSTRPGRRSGDLLAGAGTALAPTTRSVMEARLGRDLSGVRVHTDPVAGRTARALGASAFTVGPHIAFAPGRYAPATGSGKSLLAHELAHVVQQTGERTSAATATGPALEAEAEATARSIDGASRAPVPLSAAAPGIQRRVEMRDVGRGEQSGFARLPELVVRLNNISTALIFTVEADGSLSYTRNPFGTETEFDRMMMRFIDQAAVLPLRLTNRHGLLRSAPAGPFDANVDADAWATGYVDIDDMLASDDLGLQVVLVHFLAERQQTRDYARRIGTLDDTSAEFTRAHNQGVAAEVELLRDFFGDPTIRLLADGGAGDVFRRYRNSRGDTIRARTPNAPAGQPGLEANLVDVRLRSGTIMTVQDYRDLLARERAAAEAADAARARAAVNRGSPMVGPPP